MLEGLEVAPGTIFASGPRPDPADLDVFRRVGVSNVASALGGPLAQQRLLDGHALPRVSGTGVVVGFAVTIWHAPGSNGMLLHVLDDVRPGDIIVMHGPKETAQWGDIATTLALSHGVSGALVDGAVRDLERIRELGFSLWGSRIYAGQGYRKDMGMVNVPVVVGGLLIRPGDIIVADSDGILSIPASLLGVARERAMAREELERVVTADARLGESPAHRHHNFEIDPDLLEQFTGGVHYAGLTWSEFAKQAGASPGVDS